MIFELPVEVICESIFSYLCLSDLQCLNVAYSNQVCRPQLNRIWNSYKVPRTLRGGWSICQIEYIGIDIVEIQFSNAKKKTLWSYVRKISTGCPKLKVLDIARSVQLTTEMAKQLGNGCAQLEVLHLRHDGYSDEVVIALTRQCRRLNSISLSSWNITDACIESICEHCPHLLHIRLAATRSLTDASLSAIARTYPNLQSIDLRFCKFTDDGLIFFANKCHELRSVSVSGDFITSRGLTALWAANPNITQVSMPENASDEEVTLLANYCSKLQELSIWHCNKMTDASLIAVAEHCPHLNSISIRECYNITDAVLIALGQHCRELKSIDISYTRCITDVGVAALASGCPLLEKFYADETSITDASVVALSKCRHLLDFTARCTDITFECASLLKEQCPKCCISVIG